MTKLILYLSIITENYFDAKGEKVVFLTLHVIKSE